MKNYLLTLFIFLFCFIFFIDSNQCMAAEWECSPVAQACCGSCPSSVGGPIQVPVGDAEHATPSCACTGNMCYPCGCCNLFGFATCYLITMLIGMAPAAPIPPQCIPCSCCGDGEKEGTEECDGEHDTCLSQFPQFDPDSVFCTSSCTCGAQAVCGNSRIEPGEQCDPPGDEPACDPAGQSGVCTFNCMCIAANNCVNSLNGVYPGDGQICGGVCPNPSEQCRVVLVPGGAYTGCECYTPCGLPPGGLLCMGECPPGQQCKPDASPPTGCSCVTTCEQSVSTGCDGWCSPGFNCTATAFSSGNPTACGCMLIPVCGNGVIEPSIGEVCDDGNTVDNDGCSADCLSDESCGNGIVDTIIANPEQCDDGNYYNEDACTNQCLNAVCGDSIIRQDGPEDCDPPGSFTCASGVKCDAGCGCPSVPTPTPSPTTPPNT
ncbi:MAG: DUF4215 domain-containing protein [Candidatus Melainabacteria bacterium]|nr:DUF4215 domain-containing protein [Candidatus Melainabacteria bacterium]